jgi:hypothetical protein
MDNVNMENSMSKFNVGDVVRCVSGERLLPAGRLYRVTSVSGHFVYVEFVDSLDPTELVAGGWHTRRFVLEMPAKGFYGTLGPMISVTSPVAERFILIVEGDGGKLLPAPNPKTYTSEKQARYVAEEMSQKFPGNKYIVFKAFGESFTPKAETSFKAY